MTPARRRLIPYALLLPGLLWLIIFFVVPMYFMGRISLYEGSRRRAMSSPGTGATSPTR